MILFGLVLVLAGVTAEPVERPCPPACNCNMDTLSCPRLIDSCPECRHWHRIEFNQVSRLTAFSFKRFSFSSHRHYSLTIYKLLNSSLAADTFNQLIVPFNTSLQITFQYNSFIKFKPDSLSGLLISPSSTLTFHFPYTTQIEVALASLNGLVAHRAKLIFKIYKSFSVTFVSSKSLTLPNAQVLFDINSTQLVSFDHKALHSAHIVNSSLSFDLKSIEKCIIKQGSFLNSNLTKSTILIHLKQVIFLDINPGSIKALHLKSSKLKVYLVELISSFCVQPNSLSYVRMEVNSSLNLSVVQSKNVQFMSHSVSRVDSRDSSVFIGVLDSELKDEDVAVLLDKSQRSNELFSQYYYTKQKYTYNVSVARSAFSLLNTDTLVLLAHNLDTAYFDHFFVSGPARLRVVLDVKNLVMGEQSVAESELVFGSEPSVVKVEHRWAPKMIGLVRPSLHAHNYSFVKQWEVCIEEIVDYSGEVSNVLSHVYEEAEMNATSPITKSAVKLTGLFIIGLVLLILFLILVVNLVQYKYRDDSFDDLEQSSQNANAGDNLIKCENGEDVVKLEESNGLIKDKCLIDNQVNG